MNFINVISNLLTIITTIGQLYIEEIFYEKTRFCYDDYFRCPFYIKHSRCAMA